MKKKTDLPSNRNFGIVFFIIFLAIALWPLLNQNEIRFWSLIISISSNNKVVDNKLDEGLTVGTKVN